MQSKCSEGRKLLSALHPECKGLFLSLGTETFCPLPVPPPRAQVLTGRTAHPTVGHEQRTGLPSFPEGREAYPARQRTGLPVHLILCCPLSPPDVMTLDFQSPSNLLVLLRPSCVPYTVRTAILLGARNIYLQSRCCAELAKQMSSLCWRGSLLFGSHRDQPGRGARQSSRRESLTVHSPPGSQMCRAPPGH